MKSTPGMVSTIGPMICVPPAQLCIRIEDMALVIENGVQHLSRFVPSRIVAVERTIAESGLVQERRPVVPTGDAHGFRR